MSKKQKPIEEMSAEEIVALTGGRAENEPEPVKDDPPVEEVPQPPSSGEVQGTPDPWVIMNRMAAAMESLAARPAGGSEDSKALQVLTDAMIRMTDAQVSGSNKMVEEQRRAFRPSNQVIPEISVFNRRGRDPQVDEKTGKVQGSTKPPLKCAMFIPWIAEWESLTREEVELLNLLEDGAYSIKRQDRSKITMTVQTRYAEDNKTPSMLFINHETAFNQDNFRNMPPLADMLRDMLKQHDRPVAQKAAIILTDEEEEAMIEAGALTVTI